ncbi:MAG: hypothetical protein EA401_02520 [Planctomycetota bacterium]|nr:MAG: hypothetical protein EA401_02520 [Planctomycetota bacterium]
MAFPPPQQQDEEGLQWSAKIVATMLLSDAETTWRVRDAHSGEILEWVPITAQGDHGASLYMYQNGSYLVEATVREGSRSVTRQRPIDVNGGADGFAIGFSDIPPTKVLLPSTAKVQVSVSPPQAPPSYPINGNIKHQNLPPGAILTMLQPPRQQPCP